MNARALMSAVLLLGCSRSSEPSATIPVAPVDSRTPTAVAVPRPAVVGAADASAAAPTTSVAAAGGAPVADAGAPPDQRSITLNDGDLRSWVDARMADARAGKKERVRLPLARQAKGWGCVCPPHYIGVSATTAQGPWLDVTFARGTRPLSVGEVRIVEGTFGASPKHVTYPNGPPPSDAWEYDLVPFRVEKIGAVPNPSDDDTLLERLAP